VADLNITTRLRLKPLMYAVLLIGMACGASKATLAKIVARWFISVEAK